MKLLNHSSTSCVKILENNNIGFDKKTLAKLLFSNYPDFRHSISVLQKHSKCNSKIDDSVLVSEINDDSEYFNILNDIKSQNQWNYIKNALSVVSPDAFYYWLGMSYERFFTLDSTAQLVKLIAHYAYRSDCIFNMQSKQLILAGFFSELHQNVVNEYIVWKD